MYMRAAYLKVCAPTRRAIVSAKMSYTSSEGAMAMVDPTGLQRMQLLLLLHGWMQPNTPRKPLPVEYGS